MNGDSTSIPPQCHCFEGTAARTEHRPECPVRPRKPDTHPVAQVCPTCGTCPTCGRSTRGNTVTVTPFNPYYPPNISFNNG